MKKMKLALSFMFVYLLVNCINLINQEMRLQTYHARLSSDQQQMASKNGELKEELRYFKTNEGVEELARKRLGYYKNGEIPLRVIQSPTDASEPAPELVPEQE